MKTKHTPTIAELQAEIAALRARVAELEAQVPKKPEPSELPESFFVPCTGEEYPQLESILNANGYTPVAWVKGWESEGNGVKVYSDGEFQPVRGNAFNRPVVTIAELRELITPRP